MNDKKRQIIEAAIKCFAEKGYHATSIQEITDTLGIAKGSIYFYFKSKEDLFIYAFKDHVDRMFHNYRIIASDVNLTAKGRLRQQLIQQFEYHVEHRDFLKMMMKERFEMNEEIGKLMIYIRGQILQMYQTSVLDIYGEEAKPYALDAANVFSAVIGDYMMMMILDLQEVDAQRLAQFLIERLDDVVLGMIAKKQKPILDVNKFRSLSGMEKPHSDIYHELQCIQTLIEQAQLPAEKLEEALSSLVVLKEELETLDPRPAIIKGMLSNLKGAKLNELKPYLTKLAALYT